MVLKFVIADGKGKSWKFELETESLFGKNIGDTIEGSQIKPEMEEYILKITGGSDSSGFPLSKDMEGSGLKKQLLTKGFGMRDTYPGIRRRKTLRGKSISDTTAQINLKITKTGSKTLEEVFPDQNNENKKADEKPIPSS